MTGATVRIDGDSLLLPGGVRVCSVRTLRLPGKGTHPLPPGLGDFPLRRVEDYAGAVPREWSARGGVMLPVYLREAMWLSFAGTAEPGALQVGVGKVCAVSGKAWSGRLSRNPQNYLALPRQPWLDGINSGTGTVRQFVAVPLGMGATVEGQVTGEEKWGGLQLQAWPLKDGPPAAWRQEQRRAAGAEAAGGAVGPGGEPRPDGRVRRGGPGGRHTGPGPDVRGARQQAGRCAPAPGGGDGVGRGRLHAPGGLQGRPARFRLGRRAVGPGLRPPGGAPGLAAHHR
ncbi:hypothetical protein ACWDZ4_18005 [Streptomyces sp. NPDC003016]